MSGSAARGFYEALLQEPSLRAVPAPCPGGQWRLLGGEGTKRLFRNTGPTAGCLRLARMGLLRPCYGQGVEVLVAPSVDAWSVSRWEGSAEEHLLDASRPPLPKSLPAPLWGALAALRAVAHAFTASPSWRGDPARAAPVGPEDQVVGVHLGVGLEQIYRLDNLGLARYATEEDYYGRRYRVVWTRSMPHYYPGDALG